MEGRLEERDELDKRVGLDSDSEGSDRGRDGLVIGTGRNKRGRLARDLQKVKVEGLGDVSFGRELNERVRKGTVGDILDLDHTQ